MEKAAAQGEFFGAMAVGHEPVVADALETVGKDVHQKAANEFVRIKAHRLVGNSRLIVLVGKGHSAVLHPHETMVGNGDTVCVPRQVIHDDAGAGEGRLGIHHPFGLAALIHEVTEDIRLPVRFELAVELKAPIVIGSL
jgi:hypothetical protein